MDPAITDYGLFCLSAYFAVAAVITIAQAAVAVAAATTKSPEGLRLHQKSDRRWNVWVASETVVITVPGF